MAMNFLNQKDTLKWDMKFEKVIQGDNQLPLIISLLTLLPYYLCGRENDNTFDRICSYVTKKVVVAMTGFLVT